MLSSTCHSILFSGILYNLSATSSYLPSLRFVPFAYLHNLATYRRKKSRSRSGAVGTHVGENNFTPSDAPNYRLPTLHISVCTSLAGNLIAVCNRPT